MARKLSPAPRRVRAYPRGGEAVFSAWVLPVAPARCSVTATSRRFAKCATSLIFMAFDSLTGDARLYLSRRPAGPREPRRASLGRAGTGFRTACRGDSKLRTLASQRRPTGGRGGSHRTRARPRRAAVVPTTAKSPAIADGASKSPPVPCSKKAPDCNRGFEFQFKLIKTSLPHQVPVRRRLGTEVPRAQRSTALP